MANKFFFVDLETTGLNPEENVILEVAAVITDNKLNILEEFQTVVHTTEYALSLMDDWCTRTHTNSNLLKEVRSGGPLIDTVQKELIRLKRKHFPVDKPPISGSSVHFDKRFIDKYMPGFSKELSHRVIDVSSFMGALDNYYGFKLSFKAESTHRALPDIHDSIKYLKAYLEEFRC